MSKSRKINIIIADDHALVRTGFRALLETFSSVNEISEASDGQEVLQMCQQSQPDIILMDISMPKLNGLETTEIIYQKYPETAVIILSMYAEEEYILKAFDVGCSGYLLKDADLQELHQALQDVSTGHTYLSPRLPQISQKTARRSKINSLTIRQREVLQLMVEGKNTKQISQILTISPKTVDAHRHNIMNRLNIHDLASLTRYALQIGLIQQENL